MSIKKIKRHNFLIYCLVLILGTGFACFYGCGGDDGGSGDDTSSTPSTPIWDKHIIKSLTAGGLLSPHVKAAKDSDGNIQVVFFESNVPEEDYQTGTEVSYNIKHIIWDMASMEYIEDISLAELDNCSGLGFAIDHNDVPIVAYQGGIKRQCGDENQSDAMFSIQNGSSSWSEYTGAIGEVDASRNPVFNDGLAGADIIIAFDSQGDVHLGYQFKYEGCDTMNFEFPDICYVNKGRSALGNSVNEEVVEGNQYEGPGFGIQNSAGAHCSLAINDSDEPAIIYYAELPPESGFDENTNGLRFAQKSNNVWNTSWIEEDCEVGHISNAVYDESGNLHVAYYAIRYIDSQGYEHNHCLKYATLASGSDIWQIQTVDESTLCGDYCSLAFNSAGEPAIAYYAEKSRSGNNLKDLYLSQHTSGQWQKEIVETRGDIGVYNNLIFDDEDGIIIISYSRTDKMIYIFNK